MTLRDWGAGASCNWPGRWPKLAQTGACATLDVYAANWLSGAIVASLPPDRPFTLHREVSLIAETEPTPGFGHAVHTRGMMKVGRPDLIAACPPTGSRKPDRSSPPRPDAGRGPHPPARTATAFRRAKNRDGHALRSGRHHSGRHLNNDGLLIVDV